MPQVDDPFSPAVIAGAGQQIEAAHGDVLAIAQDGYDRLCHLLADRRYGQGTPDEVVYALSARVLELSATTLRSLRSGTVPSAKILTRAALEAMYKVLAIRCDATNLDQYFHDDVAARLGQNKKILEYKKAKGNKSTAKGVEKKIDALVAQKAKKIDPAEWATRAGMSDFHSLFYPWLSSDTHGNASTLDHYFNPERDHALEIGPSDSDLRMTAVVLSRSLLVILRALDAAQDNQSSAWYDAISERLNVVEAT